MDKKFLNNIDMNLNQIKKAVIGHISELPSSSTIGNFIYNSTDHMLNLYVGEEFGFRKITNINLTNLFFDDNNHLIAVFNDGTAMDVGYINQDAHGTCQTVFTNDGGENTITTYATKLSCLCENMNNGEICSFAEYTALPSVILCSAADDYVINFTNNGIGGIDYKLEIVSSDKVYITPTTKIVIDYRSVKFYNREVIKFVQADSATDALSGAGTTIAVGNMIAQPYTDTHPFIRALFNPVAPNNGETFTSGYYYPVFTGTSGVNWMKISDLKVYSNIPT